MIRPFSLILLFALAACGDAADESQPAAKSGQPAAAGKAGPPAIAWDATDACKLATKDEVGKIVGRAIEATRLDHVNRFEDGGAAVSTCYYSVGGEDVAGILTRHGWEGEGREKTVAEFRSGEFMKFEELPGEGAEIVFWQPQVKQITLLPDDRRMVVVTMGAAASGDAQAQARALADAAI